MEPLVSFPTHIEIQTTTYCGAQCSFCPHHSLHSTMNMGFMDEKLFYRIIDECSEHAVKQISPYFNAEPLTDKRIFDFIRYIAYRCPSVNIELSITGQLLNSEVREQLLRAPLGELRISSMGVRAEDYHRLMPGVSFEDALENIKSFFDAFNRLASRPYDAYIVTLDGILDREGGKKNKEFWEDRGVRIRSWEAVSRAGNVSNWKGLHHGQSIYGCHSARNTHWMSILYNGSCVLCCMDWKSEIILGYTSAKTLKEIWESEEYSKIREMSTGKIQSPDNFLCKKCEWAIT